MTVFRTERSLYITSRGLKGGKLKGGWSESHQRVGLFEKIQLEEFHGSVVQ